MSGAMRRIGEYLGLLEDTGRYDDYGDYDDGYDGYDGDRTDETTPVAVARPSGVHTRAHCCHDAVDWSSHCCTASAMPVCIVVR